MKNKNYSLPFKRKVHGRTNYRKRLKLLLGDKPRLVIRKSSKSIEASLVRYGAKGDIIVADARSSILNKFGWHVDGGNMPSAYLVGYLIGKKAKEKGIDYAVPDIGLNASIKGSRIYALISGALDAGLNLPQDKEMLPIKDRLNGTHIAKYAELIKKNKSLFEKQFSGYIKRNLDPCDIAKHFDDIKNRILAQNEK